jgi:hypothetical protein
MTVKDLKRRLESFPEHLEVRHYDSESAQEYEPITSVKQFSHKPLLRTEIRQVEGTVEPQEKHWYGEEEIFVGIE